MLLEIGMRSPLLCITYLSEHALISWVKVEPSTHLDCLSERLIDVCDLEDAAGDGKGNNGSCAVFIKGNGFLRDGKACGWLDPGLGCRAINNWGVTTLGPTATAFSQGAALIKDVELFILFSLSNSQTVLGFSFGTRYGRHKESGLCILYPSDSVLPLDVLRPDKALVVFGRVPGGTLGG